MKRILWITAALPLSVVVLRQGAMNSRRLHGSSSQLLEQILTASNRLASARASTESRSKDLALATAENSSLTAELAAADRRRSQSLASTEPTSAQPPANLPAWSPASPHIWLEKPLLKRMFLAVFLPDGSINPTAAELLALEPEEATRLADSLKRIVADHRHQETRRARVLEEHLAQISTVEGTKFTLRIDPAKEASTGLRTDFEATLTLTEQLGTQRMELLKGSIVIGLSQIFGDVGQPTQGRTLSFVRLPSGVFQLAEEDGSGIRLASGFRDIRQNVPEHLHHLIPPEFMENSDEPAEP